MIEVQCKILFSAIRIIQVWSELAQFHFPEPPLEDINLIIKYLNPRKASGPDHIPLKVFKFPSHFVDSHLSNVRYSGKPEAVSVWSILKKIKETRQEIIG